MEQIGLDAEVAADLVTCEALLRDAVRSPANPFLATVSGHLLSAGGKRLRPTLALLAARFGDPARPEVARAAAVVELLHVASLHHDDVMDLADTRRGADSVNARWGNSVAILSGDYLVARAAELAVPLGPEAVVAQAKALSRLVEGQVNETVGAGDRDPEEHYLRVVADKTAALFVLAVRLGGHAAAVPADQIECLARYAAAFGIAFQLADDVLDLTAPAQHHGKPLGADVRQGLRTLPVLRALRGSRTRRWVGGAVLAGAMHGGSAHRLAVAMLRRSGGLADARAEVARHADRARAELSALPDSPARRALDGLVVTVVDRALQGQQPSLVGSG